MANGSMGKRGFVSGNFALDLDGMRAGWIFSYEGGMAQGEVVPEKIGHDNLEHKHISGIKYEDIAMTCGPAMSREFYKWIKNSFKKDYERKTGAFVQADYDFTEMSRLNFYEALVTEVGFPACDASSKDMARLTVKMSPEWTRFEMKKGGKITGGAMAGTDPIKQKRWLSRNFEVKIDGLDCSRINKVESITIKQKVAEVPLGEMRELYREPTTISYSNVVLSMPESHAESWLKWYDSFVIKGKCEPSDEKHGHIRYLHEDMKTMVCDIELMRLGIFKVTPDKAEAGSDKIRSVKVELYCEQMDFGIKEAWA